VNAPDNIERAEQRRRQRDDRLGIRQWFEVSYPGSNGDGWRGRGWKGRLLALTVTEIFVLPTFPYDRLKAPVTVRPVASPLRWPGTLVPLYRSEYRDDPGATLVPAIVEQIRWFRSRQAGSPRRGRVRRPPALPRSTTGADRSLDALPSCHRAPHRPNRPTSDPHTFFYAFYAFRGHRQK